MICDACGKDYALGEWPWCPHGMARKKTQGFTPYWDEHIDETPQYIDSAKKLDAIAKRNNIHIGGREHISDINHRREKLGLAPLRN